MDNILSSPNKKYFASITIIRVLIKSISVRCDE